MQTSTAIFNKFLHKGIKYITLFIFVFEHFGHCLSYSELSNWRIWIYKVSIYGIKVQYYWQFVGNTLEYLRAQKCL